MLSRSPTWSILPGASSTGRGMMQTTKCSIERLVPRRRAAVDLLVVSRTSESVAMIETWRAHYNDVPPRSSLA